MEEFKNRLLKLNEEIEKLEKNSQEKGDKFNIFSILDRERKEVGTHSFLLYELINPNGSHYKKNLYLEIFIKEVLGIYDFEFKNFEVNRETFISGKGIKNGFIDFTIENNDYFIAIEMKIGSLETGEQLDNYKAFLDSIPNKEKRLYYLTLFGDEADKSKIKEDEYIRISFLEHISKFIEKSIEQSNNLPTIKEILVHYQKTIKNITNQATGEFSEMIEDLIKEPKMVKTVTILSKELPYLWAKREVIFWRELAKKLENYLEDKGNWNLVQDIFLSTEDEIIDDNKVIEKWIVEDLGKTHFRGFDIKLGNNRFFEILLYTNGSFEYHIYKEYSELLPFKKKHEKYETFYKESKYKYNFSKDSKNPTYDVFDDEKLDEIVKFIFKEAKSYLDTIINSKLV
ncbi:hypothetical protein AAX26_00529 [Aliarcobacter thereius]|uniref:PDDEXK-like family protein n=1 Tax=Aliarcobacter thereius TaxID=544718 RepID=UPI00082861B9|nr:PD-(D/E)XK nuclease family protein [Aliarcobacter thereius]OCL88835.1 hypothetical protein AAX26_00529 [Aliarcobacter thereius]